MRLGHQRKEFWEHKVRAGFWEHSSVREMKKQLQW